MASLVSESTQQVVQGEWALPSPLSLHFGGQLSPVTVAWRLEGRADAPVVLALGGISANREVASTSTGEPGWWPQVVGVGKALDTQQFRVLGMDYLGGSGGTTGPAAGQQGFPSISAHDQVILIKALLAQLGIASLHAVVGASYGGMVALCMGEREPQLAQRLVVISAAHRTHPMSTAWRSVQRAMVRHAIAQGDAREGLCMARALAMATYRSPQEFAQRFSSEPVRVQGRFMFPVEQYLFARGEAYTAQYVPESFLCLSESIDLHRVDPARIHTPTTLVAVREDQLVPLADMQHLHGQLAGPKHWVELSSLYGHDAFLKEAASLRAAFAAALA